MEAVRITMSRDLIIAHLFLQSFLFMLFHDVSVNLSFLVGGAISLANFQLMIQDCEAMRGFRTSGRMISGMTFRFLIMGGVVALALLTGKFNAYALLGGLFTLQASLVGRQLFWLASTILIKRNA